MDGRARRLESWQGREIKTRGGGLEVDGVEDGFRQRNGAEAEGGLKGLDKTSATGFLAPGTWTISLVNSEI